MGSTKYALRVIEGKLRGYIYDLPENSELFLGRGANFDIVIDEDMVSRRHAKILTFHDQIVLQDLNSTNGTSVNKQRIQGSQRLQLGDSVTVGTCILELIQAPQQPGLNAGAGMDVYGSSSSGGNMNAGGAFPNQPTNNAYGMGNPAAANPLNATVTPPLPTTAQGNSPLYNPPGMPPAQSQPGSANFGMFPNQTNQPAPSQFAQSMANPPHQAQANSFNGMASIGGARPRMKSVVGSFPSAETADVISMIERLIERRHDGILAVFDPEEREGSIYFRGGRVYFATYEDPHRVMEISISPQEALSKLCSWTQGRYKVKNMNALPSFEQEISEDSRSLLERVRHHCTELNQLRSQIPPLTQRLSLCQPLNPPLTALSQEQLYLLQLAINQYEIRAVVDCHPQGEREGIKALLLLLEQGYLQS